MGKLILSLGMLAFALPAMASDCYGSFVVENPTANDIHYQIRWGDGEWKSHCVYSGRRSAHYYPVRQDGTVPQPQIRFDSVGGDGDVTFKTYNANVYHVNSYWDGKAYVFRYSRCGRYLDIYGK